MTRPTIEAALLNLESFVEPRAASDQIPMTANLIPENLHWRIMSREDAASNDNRASSRSHDISTLANLAELRVYDH
jgi:hypothetical protein